MFPFMYDFLRHELNLCFIHFNVNSKDSNDVLLVRWMNEVSSTGWFVPNNGTSFNLNLLFKYIS